jgi:hypothetical protein
MDSQLALPSSIDHTRTQACFAPCVTSPLPAKKSTKLGAGGFMRSFEQLEGGLSKGDFGEREKCWSDCAELRVQTQNHFIRITSWM